MNILITGSNGFIGKNLSTNLLASGFYNIFYYDNESTEQELEDYCSKCDFVYHLAGINRPKNESEFTKGNITLTEQVVTMLERKENICPIVLSSSIQAENESAYGLSKRKAEKIIFEYGVRNAVEVYVFRLPGVFGKWCRPNYNSVVATFCNNIAKGEEITINGKDTEVELVYIDDVINDFFAALKGSAVKNEEGYCSVSTIYKVTLGEIADLLFAFRETRKTLAVPDMGDSFTKKLYSTYLSYLGEEDFSYPLKMNKDDRGSFTEIIKTSDRGQFSVNIVRPGIIKGQHWHNTKNEKFLVVKGEGVIRFRKIGHSEIIEYAVAGSEHIVVDIPVGYTHNIENTGESDMVVFMWCNECFNPAIPDTFYEEV